MATTTTAGSQDVALAEQLATRLCHDIAGLCGTLVGVLELAAEDPASVAEALPLAHEMATSLSARLRLMRAAWGPPGDPLDAGALRLLGNGLPGAPRLRLEVAAFASDYLLPPVLGRIVLNALLVGAEALPGGGTLSLSQQRDGLKVSIAGRRPGWPAALAELIEQPHRASTTLREAGPRKLQAPLLVLLAQAADIRLQLLQADGEAAASLYIAGAEA
jgi:histidine phosphotransferase ChpT